MLCIKSYTFVTFDCNFVTLIERIKKTHNKKEPKNMKTETTQIKEVMNYLSSHFEDKSCQKAYSICLGGHLDSVLAQYLISNMKITGYDSMDSFLLELGLTPDISLYLIEAKIKEITEEAQAMTFNKWDSFYEVLHAFCFNRASVQGDLENAVTIASERLLEYGSPMIL